MYTQKDATDLIISFLIGAPMPMNYTKIVLVTKSSSKRACEADIFIVILIHEIVGKYLLQRRVLDTYAETVQKM